MNKYKMLIINPGSTSTKVAVYENEQEVFREEVRHDEADLLRYENMIDQLNMRTAAILEALEKHDFDISSLSGVVGRGGMIPGLKVGAYGVNEALRQVIRGGNLTPHASNLGALLADAIAEPLGIPAIIYDAVSSDNMVDVARITGLPEIRRQSFCHVLNSRAMSRKYAQSLGKEYEDLRLLVAHLGGGISISAHLDGKIIDVVSDDEGPFSPERSGNLPTQSIINLCFDKGYSKADVMKKQRGQGGLKALIGTSDCREVEKRIVAGDASAALCYQAMAYEIAKGIAKLTPALDCKIDAIILTGGIAYSEMLTTMIQNHVQALAPVVILPGENEMSALALGMYRVLTGEEKLQDYQGIPS